MATACQRGLWQTKRGSPKDAHTLLPEACDYGTLHSKKERGKCDKDFWVDGEMVLDNLGESNVITGVLKREKECNEESRACCCFEGEGRGHEPRNVGGLQELKKSETVSPLRASR